MKSLSQDKFIKISYLSSGKWDVGQVRHGVSTAFGLTNKIICVFKITWNFQIGMVEWNIFLFIKLYIGLIGSNMSEQGNPY